MEGQVGLDAADLLDRARGTEAWAGRSTPIDVILQNDRPWDPIAEADRVADL